MTTTTTLTRHELAFAALCMSGTHEREAAIANCRQVLGRALITTPGERANVAAYLAAGGRDGIGRVQLALADLNKAARGDLGLRDSVAGRVAAASGLED